MAKTHVIKLCRTIEREGTHMVSDLTMLTIWVAINIAVIMLAILMRDT